MSQPLSIPGEIRVATLFVEQADGPLVQLELPARLVRLSPEDATRVGLRLLEAAKASAIDGFLIAWLRENSFAEDHVETMLTAFRDWRAGRALEHPTEGQ